MFPRVSAHKLVGITDKHETSMIVSVFKSIRNYQRSIAYEQQWGNNNCGNETHDKSWYAELGLGLNAIAVTAPVCPRKTEIGNPSGKRHCTKQNNNLHNWGIKIEFTRFYVWILTTRMMKSFEADATRTLFELTAKSVMSPYKICNENE